MNVSLSQLARSAALALSSALVLAATIQSNPVQSAEFPQNRPIRLFVGVTAGGATDVVGRLLAKGLGEALKTSVVVENRPGGNFALAAAAVKSAEADGHTLLLMSTSYTMTQGLRKNLPYDLVTDFTPVAQVGTGPLILVGRKDLPARDLAAFLALARSRPGNLKYASAGAGTVTHLPGVLLMQLAKLDLVHVPYRGGGPALNDLLGGHVDVMFDPATTLIPQIQNGSVIPYGVTSPQRMTEIPDVPTLAEAGLPGFDVQSWYGIMAPLGTPPEIVARIQQELAKVLQSNEVKERYAALGMTAGFAPPAEFTRYLKSEVNRWAKLIKDNNITAD
jgi:tripartite-type tricarboxylate transporter receptor subunit TctC